MKGADTSHGSSLGNDFAYVYTYELSYTFLYLYISYSRRRTLIIQLTCSPQALFSQSGAYNVVCLR